MIEYDEKSKFVNFYRDYERRDAMLKTEKDSLTMIRTDFTELKLRNYPLSKNGYHNDLPKEFMIGFLICETEQFKTNCNSHYRRLEIYFTVPDILKILATLKEDLFEVAKKEGLI